MKQNVETRSPIIYFAYGSNMSEPRIQQRVPSARYLGNYYLPKHALRFHKLGQDGSAKCDAYFTNDESDIVHGAVFEFCPSEKYILDAAEGLGVDYYEKIVTVYNNSEQALVASIYYSSDVTVDIAPYHWYKHHVAFGAEQSNLPQAYIDQIKNVRSVDDIDRARAAREMSIY